MHEAPDAPFQRRKGVTPEVETIPGIHPLEEKLDLQALQSDGVLVVISPSSDLFFCCSFDQDVLRPKLTARHGILPSFGRNRSFKFEPPACLITGRAIPSEERAADRCPPASRCSRMRPLPGSSAGRPSSPSR